MLKIVLRPSRRLALLLCAAHAAAAGAVVAIDLPLWLKIPLVLLIGASCAVCLYGSALLRGTAAIIALEIGKDDTVNVQTQYGEWREGRLMGTTFVSPWLTVLNLKIADRRFASHVVILADSMETEDFRRLRVRLRWAAGSRRAA